MIRVVAGKKLFTLVILGVIDVRDCAGITHAPTQFPQLMDEKKLRDIVIFVTFKSALKRCNISALFRSERRDFAKDAHTGVDFFRPPNL